MRVVNDEWPSCDGRYRSEGNEFLTRDKAGRMTIRLCLLLSGDCLL